MNMNRRQFVITVVNAYYAILRRFLFRKFVNYLLNLFNAKPGRIIDVRLAVTGYGTGTTEIGVELVKGVKI